MQRACFGDDQHLIACSQSNKLTSADGCNNSPTGWHIAECVCNGWRVHRAAPSLTLKKNIIVQNGCSPPWSCDVLREQTKKALKCRVRHVNEYNDCVLFLFLFLSSYGCMTSHPTPLYFCTLCIIHIICSHYLSTNLLNYFCVLTPKGLGLWYHV